MTVDPSWAARTPDANDELFKAGPGPASMLAALSAYTAEMATMEAAAGASTANQANLTPEFSGLSSMASSATTTAINTAAHLLFGWLAEKPPIITSAVNAFTVAYSAMVPAPLCHLNRAEWATFNALNSVLPGAFLPQMLDRDREYFGHFWPNNATAGATYAAALTALIPALAVPPPITPPGATADLPGTAASAVAQTASTGAAGDAMRVSSGAAKQLLPGAGTGGGMDGVQAALQPLQQGVGAVPKAFESLTSGPQQMVQPAMSMLQSFGGMSGLKAGDLPAPVETTPRTGVPAATPLGPTAGAGGSGISSGVAPPTTQYVRPASSFGVENGGRPTALRVGLLGSGDARGPVTTGAGMPLGPSGMLARPQGDATQPDGTRARVVVGGTERGVRPS